MSDRDGRGDPLGAVVFLQWHGKDPQAVGFTYHVRPAGPTPVPVSRPKTIGTPLLTINKAIECAGPGDTVQLAAGVFTQRINLNSSAGGSAAGGHLTVQPRIGTSTILRGTDPWQRLDGCTAGTSSISR